MNFEFENHDVETLTLNEEALFNPYHIGSCLGMDSSTVRNHLSEMDENEKILLKNSDVRLNDIRKFNNAGETFLKESGVYELIFNSRKPEAKKFRKWLTNEVLPAIRRTGNYQLESANSQLIKQFLETSEQFLGIRREELARVKNESCRAKLANLINDIAKREGSSPKSLYERLYYLFAGETGFHIPELAEKAKMTNPQYLRKHELSAEMLYKFALGYFYKDKRFVELISLNPDQRTLGEF